VEITSEIPLPSLESRFKQKYHFYKLGVGDSFSVPYTSEADIARFRAAVSAYTTRNQRVFTTRTTIEDGEKFCRVWRVE
tara:strand:- start:1903 stop:2139 length:237 start_codon:yes stop_codon:yes gene_type:complete